MLKQQEGNIDPGWSQGGKAFSKMVWSVDPSPGTATASFVDDLETPSLPAQPKDFLSCWYHTGVTMVDSISEVRNLSVEITTALTPSQICLLLPHLQGQLVHLGPGAPILPHHGQDGARYS